MGRRQKKTPALKIKAGVLLCCRPPAKLIHGVQRRSTGGTIRVRIRERISRRELSMRRADLDTAHVV